MAYDSFASIEQGAAISDSPKLRSGLTGKAETLPPLRVVGLHDFIAMDLPKRDVILGPWLMTQSLNMVYGWRGVGKTHVSLGVSYAVACGGSFLNWRCDKPDELALIHETARHDIEGALIAYRIDNAAHWVTIFG